MRVLHFYKTSKPDSTGGIEQVINQIARSTNNFGVKSEVLSIAPSQAPDQIEFDGYSLHRTRRSLKVASTDFSLSAISRFAQLAKKVDVVHYHFPWPFMDFLHFATQVKKPTVLTYHSDIIRQKYLYKIYEPLMHKFLNDVNQIVSTSPNYIVSSKVLARYAFKISMIPIGLDKNSYPMPSIDKLKFWRNRYSGNFFLFIGAFRYYKGLHILLEAAKGINYPIVIIGSGPIEKELKLKAVQFGLNNIDFLGQLSEEDKVALLTICYGVLFPSHLRSEAFGVSLLEGAMYGKPLISSEIGTGTSFVNINGETGLVVQSGDPVSLREAMRFLWEHPEQARDMGHRAEERYWNLFTSEKMAQSYVDVYKGLINAQLP